MITERAWLDEIRDYTARECLTDDEWNTLLSLAYDGQTSHIVATMEKSR